MDKDEALARYQVNKDTSIATWRRLFDKELAGSYYRPYRAHMAFSLNDYPRPFDYTIIEFNGKVSIHA